MPTRGLISSRVNRGYLVNPQGIQPVSRGTSLHYARSSAPPKSSDGKWTVIRQLG
jgi:hypothetical protein